MTVLFINASSKRDGNTATCGEQILANVEHTTCHLVDYRIGLYGQQIEGDEFDKVWEALEEADLILLATPMYWHQVSGSLKVLMERMSARDGASLRGRKLIFFFQGGYPTEDEVAVIDNMMAKFAESFGLELVVSSHSREDVPELAELAEALS
ncbi:NAD(P)H-dependent oxidoreductase [Arcanobacterium haemolyticum]|nr:NAD(P)H-dependent oxidoreductase [Arcanobacterium haemolyticum]